MATSQSKVGFVDAPKPEGSKAKAAPTSTLDALNTTLLALGLTKRALDLSALPPKQLENVQRVLFGLLDRRGADQAAIEDLEADCRGVRAELERSRAEQRRREVEGEAVRREVEVCKAQLAATAAKLKKEEQAHRACRVEADKSRTALALVRTQAQHENKKREVQLEKTMANWQRLASEHARLLSGNITTGLLCLNPVDGAQPGPRVDSFWDPSVRALDQVRVGLQEENDAFRHVTLSIGNKLRSALAAVSGEEPPFPMTPSTFFNSGPSTFSSTSSSIRQVSSSTSHPSAADAKLKGLVADLQARILAGGHAPTGEAGASEKLDERETARHQEQEMAERMREMERELAMSREIAAEHQRMIQHFSQSEAAAAAEAGHSGASSSADTEREALMLERQQLTERAVRLGQERAQLETERRLFEEQRRTTELQALLDGMPDSPPEASTTEQASQPVVTVTTTATATSAHLSVPAPASRPAISSPLRRRPTSAASPSSSSSPSPSSSPSSRSRSPHASRSPASSPASAAQAARRRSQRRAKGSATPLARLVLTKVTIERASERKASRVLAPATSEIDHDAFGPKPSSGTSASQGLSEGGNNANRGAPSEEPRADVKGLIGMFSKPGQPKPISPTRRRALLEAQQKQREGGAAREKQALAKSIGREGAPTSALDRSSGIGPAREKLKRSEWR